MPRFSYNLFSFISKRLGADDVGLAQLAEQCISRLQPTLESKDKSGDIDTIYRAVLDTINSIATRRIMVNTFFVTIFTLVLAALGYLINEFNNHVPLFLKLLLSLPFLGVIFACYVWLFTIKNYFAINTVFIMILKRIELSQDMLEKPMNLLLPTLEALGKGYNLSNLEQGLPILFVLLYFVTFIIICTL